MHGMEMSPWSLNMLSKELKFVASLSAGVFAGGALYCSVVEIPSRRDLPTASKWSQWKNSFNRAGKYMPMLGFLNSCCSTALFFLDESQHCCNCVWLINPAIFLTTGIYSFIVIIPEVKTMLDDKVIDTKGEKWVDDAITRWDRRNHVRTCMDMLLFGWTVFVALNH